MNLTLFNAGRKEGARKSLCSRILIAALVAWAVITILPGLAQVFTDYDTWPFSVNNDGYVYEVAHDKEETVPLQTGDVIELRDTSWRDLLSVFGGGGMQYVLPNSKIHLSVYPAADHDGVTTHAPQERFVRSVPAPMELHERILLLVTQLLGVLFVVLAAMVVWQQPNAMTWGFFLYSLWFNPGLSFVTYAELVKLSPVAVLIQHVLQILSQGVGYAGFLVFMLRFPSNRTEPRWQWIEQCAPWAGASVAVFQLIGLLAIFGYKTALATNSAYVVSYLVALFSWIILRTRARYQISYEYQRSRWVLWGAAVGLLGFSLADNNIFMGFSANTVVSNPGRSAFMVLYCLNAIVVFAVVHAIRWHRVIDVRFVVSRGATMALTWALLGSVLWWLFHKIIEYGHGPNENALLYTPILVILTLVKEKIHEYLNRVADWLFFRRHYMTLSKLRELAHHVEQIEDLDRVDSILVDEPFQLMRLESACLLRVKPPGVLGVRRSAGRVGTFAKVTTHFRAISEQLQVTRRPLRLSHFESVCLSGERAPVLAVPILEGRTLVAMALYGAHASGTDLGDEEVAALGELGKAAAMAYVSFELSLRTV